MTPITDAERIIWQRQAHALLGDLLKRAAKEHLPPIRWCVGTRCELRGECSPYDEDPRGEFEAWMAVFGQPDQNRMVREDGATRLTAVWDRYNRVQIILTATIYDEPAGE
jgi:hypothetical protein